MSSYRQILYHIVFRTKYGRKTLPIEFNNELFTFILGVIRENNCVLYRINGMQDHVHLLSDLHPTLSLADFVRDIKVSSCHWMKHNPNFATFEGWASGYAALTYAFRDKDMIINYIKNQQEHHREKSFVSEYSELLLEHGIVPDSRFFP